MMTIHRDLYMDLIDASIQAVMDYDDIKHTIWDIQESMDALSKMLTTEGNPMTRRTIEHRGARMAQEEKRLTFHLGRADGIAESYNSAALALASMVNVLDLPEGPATFFISKYPLGYDSAVKRLTEAVEAHKEAQDET